MIVWIGIRLLYSSRPLLFRAVAQPVPGLPLLNLLVVALFDICLYLGIGCRHPLLFKEFLRPVPDQVLEKPAEPEPACSPAGPSVHPLLFLRL